MKGTRFDNPCRIAASMPERCSVIVLASLTNGSRRQRLAEGVRLSVWAA